MGWEDVEEECKVELFCAEIMLKLGTRTFFTHPHPILMNLLIEIFIYCYLYALNQGFKSYPTRFSDFRNIYF